MPPIRDSFPPTVEAAVRQSALGDAATSDDALDFAPYVEAVSEFLTSADTLPPLTISIEGDWGSGKSSFMLMLQRAMRASKGRNYFVRFNAWQYEKDEALWAAFALNFVRELGQQLTWWRRFHANVLLLWQRLDWEQGRFRIFRTAACLAAIIVLGIGGVLEVYIKFPIVTSHPAWYASLLAFSGLVGTALTHAFRVVGSPFERDLKRYFDAPDYLGKRAFIETFYRDFARIVKSYVRSGDRVFVFVDDLDRCEVPRAADLLQALNLMMSPNESLPIIYIIGFDRQLVAASIAATLEKQSEFLFPQATRPDELAIATMDLSLGYVEKFIQVSFRVPIPDAEAVRKYVTTMATGIVGRESSNSLEAASQRNETQSTQNRTAPRDSVLIKLGAESQDVRSICRIVAPLFDNNPRRIKQFLNVFRLQAIIADRLGMFEYRETLAKTLTLPKLAKVVAILLRYPSIAQLLRSRPNFLQLLQQRAARIVYPDDDSEPRWSRDDDFERYKSRRALMELVVSGCPDDSVDLDQLDVALLLRTVPARRMITGDDSVGASDPKPSQKPINEGL